MELKPALTYEGQIEHLKNYHNLHVEDYDEDATTITTIDMKTIRH